MNNSSNFEYSSESNSLIHKRNGIKLQLKNQEMMRGRLASRAHSFKENFLNVFGHHSPQHQHDNSCTSSNSAANSTFDDSNLSATNMSSVVAGSNPAGSVTSDGSVGHGRNGAAKNHHDKSLTKKTNSTDNIIDFVTTSTNTVADPRSTEVNSMFNPSDTNVYFDACVPRGGQI